MMLYDLLDSQNLNSCLAKIVELDYDTPFTHAITVAIQQSPLGNIINFCCRERPSLKSHCLNFAYQFDLL